MSAASFNEILSEREQRSELRRGLISEYGLPCVTLTLNLPGSEKRSLLSDYAFVLGKRAVLSQLSNPVYFTEKSTNAGCCAFFIFDEKPEKLKRICAEIEDSSGGRIFDLDVHTAAGEKLSRSVQRRCFLCEKPAAECARSRAHSLSDVLKKTREMLCKLASEGLSASAENALYDELYLAPKPGLVCPKSSGAHVDMCAADFEHAIAALRPFFKEAVLMGLNENGAAALQALGLHAEEAMFAATGGINTHKGAIYLFLLLLCGIGAHLAGGADIFETSAETAKNCAAAKDTHGEKVREKYHCCGAREEAQNGFPAAKKAFLSLQSGSSPLRVLFEIMSELSDTNILYRGGKSGLDFMQKSAAAALEHGDFELEHEAEKLNAEFIKRNLSPGGCADILALALFMNSEPEIFSAEFDKNCGLC